VSDDGVLKTRVTRKDHDIKEIGGILRLIRFPENNDYGMFEVVPIGWQLTPEEMERAKQGGVIEFKQEDVKARRVLCEDMKIDLNAELAKFQGKHVKILIAEMEIGERKTENENIQTR